MTTLRFRQLTAPLMLSLCLTTHAAYADDAPDTTTEAAPVAAAKETPDAPQECAQETGVAPVQKKRKKGKRNRKNREILPVDDTPSVDKTRKKEDAPQPTNSAAKDTREENGAAEDEEVAPPEANEDEWSPASHADMVAPKPEAPKPPPDPLHFDKIDLSEFDIPIEDNEQVRKWLNWFIGPGHDIYQRWLDKGYRYQPMMKAALKEAGLPTDLVYLSMIESGYQIKATSRARAGGLWQFMPATGERFKLEQNYWVDERYDPEKALHAAIQYLSILYKRFDSWPLAWAAYNAGEGRIGRAIKYSGTRDFFKLAETKYIVAETKRYVPKIMATAILGHYPELYGFRPAKTGEPLQYDTTTLDGAVELAVIAKCADTSVSTIKQLNPALKSFATPPSSYDLRIPVGTKAAFDKALSKIPPEKRITTIRHKVRKGESLGRIATRYNTTIDVIIRANKIRNANRIYPGMRLTIPRSPEAAALLASSSPTKSSTSSTTKKSSSSRAKTYTVRKGDYLSKIAGRTGLSVSKLKQYNGLSSDTITVGQVLRLSPTRTASTSTTKSSVYTVKKGDTLSQIAERHGMGLSTIQRINNIQHASNIQVGQRLKVTTQSSSAWATYKVRAGDSLGLIATRNGCTVKDLKSWNTLNSTVIHPGQRLRIRK